MEKFFAHVARLLKPNGDFLCAGIHFHDELETWHQQQNLVQNYVPALVRPIVARFDGTDGGRLAANVIEPGRP